MSKNILSAIRQSYHPDHRFLCVHVKQYFTSEYSKDIVFDRGG